ncbi:hypothetical protein DICVIV_14453 [Dictyocaulus viviparus]|uniref:Uncharacterized protein n=1 Tax=Dictyocaulus viviparus TaxID=29172 RepID=A0A0D8X540_DICVI|nr:hypothetical protein DICVIV_14453 [Dictyocaulus viviparus]
MQPSRHHCCSTTFHPECMGTTAILCSDCNGSI